MQAARLLSPSPFKRLGRVVEARALSGVGGSGSEDAYLETWQRSKVCMVACRFLLKGVSGALSKNLARTQNHHLQLIKR